MSIAILVQVYDEMRRLAIAGSTVASGDFRLKKLVGPLEKSGEKAPVFAKVAQAVQAVVDSTDKTASTALLELTTLVNAILYTQGETGMAGEWKVLETTNLGGQVTQASARVLKPLLEALSSTGSGRIELIRDAQERGAFKDLRLVKPALGALDDPYSEIGDLIAEKVLPIYGKAILPELRGKIDIKERTSGHLNRLRLMHKLDAEGSRDVIQLALNEGSKEMKVVAVECLGTSSEDLVYLLEQVKAKAKDVRAAALRALVASGITRADVVGAMKKGIDGEDLEAMIERVRQCTLPVIQTYVIEQAEKQLAEVLKLKDAKLQGPAVERMQQLVLCLEGRVDSAAEEFLLKCFAKAGALAAIKSEPSGTDLNELVAQLMARGTPKMQKELVAQQAGLKGGSLTAALHAARAIMTPGDFYGEFAGLLKPLGGKKARKGSAESERGLALVDHLSSTGMRYYYRRWSGRTYFDDPREEKRRELDPRWLDAAIEVEATELVCELARPGHAGAIAFLSQEMAKTKKAHESSEVLAAMVRIGHPEAADVIIDSLKKQAKDATSYYYSYWYSRMIPDLPRSTLARFEELLPTLPEKMVDQLMDAVLALKNKPE